MRSLGCLLLLLGVFVGCGGSSSTTTPSSDVPVSLPDTASPSDTSSIPVPQGCQDDSDCTDQICDCLGRCVEPGVAGLTCVEDINCGSGYFCDTCAGVCRAQNQLCEPCSDSTTCADDGVCVDFASGGRYCLRQCETDFGCPQPEYSCKAIDGVNTSQCVPATGSCVQLTECSVTSDCELGERCLAGKCSPGCQDDAECGANICSAFDCVPPCSETNPCPTGWDCEPSGHCKLEGGCLEPSDCLEAETYCDVNTNLCQPGCLTDFDCKSSAKQCTDGKCEPKGCTANYFCAFEEVCDFSTGKCIPAPGPHCEAGCDPQSETACGGKPNWCLSLQDADGNDQGAFCFVGCSDDPKNLCPQGYQCQEIKDDTGATQGTICGRDCTVSPIE